MKENSPDDKVRSMVLILKYFIVLTETALSLIGKILYITNKQYF